jgi:hypothetical protein
MWYIWLPTYVLELITICRFISDIMTGHSSQTIGSRLRTLKVQAAASCDTSANSTNLHGISAVTTLRLTILIASTGTFCYTNQYHSTAVTIPTTRFKKKTTAFCPAYAYLGVWSHYDSSQHKLCHSSGRSLTAETQIRRQDSPCEICAGQSGTVTGFPPSTSAFRV